MSIHTASLPAKTILLSERNSSRARPSFHSAHHRLSSTQHPLVLHLMSSWPSTLIGERQVSHLSLAQRGERLQSGLADAVILVESAEQSGSMHTVRFTTLQKRIVGCVSFANPEIPSASGNRSLVQSGRATPLPSMAAVEDFCAKLWQKKSRKKQKKSKPATTKLKAQKQMELHF